MPQATRTIELTQGQVAIVDAASYEQLNAHKWCAWWNRNTRSFYACRSSYRLVDGKKKPVQVYMHRVLLGLEYGNKLQGDHADHNSLNNCMDNLRAATRAEQQQNTRKRITSKSGFKGVSWVTRRKRWIAKITINGRHIHLGSYLTAEAAALAYDLCARAEFGVFALCNFPLAEQSFELPIAA